MNFQQRKLTLNKMLTLVLSLLIALLVSIIFMSQVKSFQIDFGSGDFFFIGPGFGGNFGEIQTKGANGNPNFRLTSLANDPNLGFLGVMSADFDKRAADVLASNDPYGSGRIQLHDGTTANPLKVDIGLLADTQGYMTVDGKNQYPSI